MSLLEELIIELPAQGGWPELRSDGLSPTSLLDESNRCFLSLDKERSYCLYNGEVVTRQEYETAVASQKGDWITWGGGERPVKADAMVDAMFRYKKVVATSIADYWRWNHNGTDSDIIAYRLHKPAEQQLPTEETSIWNGEGVPPVGCECQYRKHKKTEYSEWFYGVVKYASEFTVVIQPVCYPAETVGHPAIFEFRPIRSEADMKRDELAKALHIAAGAAPVELGGIGPIYLELADKIIAGEIPNLKIV